MSGLCCFGNLSEVGRKKNIYIFYGFQSPPNQIEVKYVIINFKINVFWWKGHWNLWKAEKQRKNRTKVWNLTKKSKG